MLFRFERSMEFCRGERLLLSRLALQLGLPCEEAALRSYFSAEDAGLGDLFPEFAAIRDIAFVTKGMMVPSADALPEVRAWCHEDARLTWKWKEDRFVVRAFGGGVLQCAGWLDPTGEDDSNAAGTARPGFIQRMLGRTARPRVPPSAADASRLVGCPVSSEEDVLHVRHLPDFGGVLKAADCEVLVQVLLVPYLRIPLLLHFFAEPSHTSALASSAVQQMVDAALFEPGEWQPDTPKSLPSTIPDPQPAHLATAAGLLFNELTHSPSVLLSSVVAILDNALELDIGHFVRGGRSASVVLYAIRLALRVEGYARFLLDPSRASARGLSSAGETDRELRQGAAVIRTKLEDHAFLVLQSWYDRLRAEDAAEDACTVAAHMSFIFAQVEEAELDARVVFTLVSSRIFINMHLVDMELEPELGLLGTASRPRRRSLPGGESSPTGFPPMELLDLWQRHVCKLLKWLQANQEEASAVLEAVAQLEPSMQRAELPKRPWRSLVGCGCGGRFVLQLPPSDMPSGIAASPDLDNMSYEAWLRSRVCAQVDTEINLQLGHLTWKRHHMQLLERAIVQHEDFVHVFGAKALRERHQCAEVKRSEHRRWLRLLGAMHDLHVWGVDDRRPPSPACPAGADAQERRDRFITEWVNPTLEPLKEVVPLLSKTQFEVADAQETFALLFGMLDGELREAVLVRQPLVLQVFAVTSHGRCWRRTLVYTTDAKHCLADLRTRSLEMQPRPYWTGGDSEAVVPREPSLVILRSVTENAHPQTCVPARHLRGLLPDALVFQYTFWLRESGSMVSPLGSEPAPPLV